MRTPELLCPAGSAPAMVAAVQCGADAVYLGASGFNARQSAENFGGELEAAALYCHARGAKVYVTLNTMVRQDELPALERTIEEICASGADGAIVADLGVARALKQMAPTLALHASTQLAVHNPQGVELLARSGFSRVVLARELTFEEIARCKGLGAELEVFVHGALCVSCSGQCLMSSMIGGRSGNRGLCAQPCRMRYRMDDREGHLLSTRDLCALGDLRALIDAGADSLKIEGRLKRPEYVAEAAFTYRAALDAIASGGRFDADSAREDLAQMFNRGGFTRGYGPGVNDAALIFPERPNHIGVEIGVCRRAGEIELSRAVDGRDALVLRGRGGDRPVHPGARAPGRVRMDEAWPGDVLARLVSQAQMQSAQARFMGEHRKFEIDMTLSLRVGQPAMLALSDGAHRAVCAGEVVQASQSRPLDAARARAQLEKLGDTPFVLKNFSAEMDANAHLPASALNALRRRGVEELFLARGGNPHACAKMAPPKPRPESERETALAAQSGDVETLLRAAKAGADALIFAPEDVRPFALESAAARLPERFELAVPPVLGEASLAALNEWARGLGGRIDRCYLGNIGQLGLDWPGERAGDFMLNVANALSLDQLSDWNVGLYTPSVELNRAQIESLGGQRALIVYGALPLMQLRHCPLRAMRGDSGPHANCRACDHCAPDARVNAKALIDRTGARFPLRRIATDEGCVVQLLNYAKLMPLRRRAALPRAEVWRLLLGADDAVEAVVRMHRIALDGGDPRADADWPALEKMNATAGHYFRGAE